MDLVVEPLADHPEAVPVAAEWQFREWGHTDPGGSLEAWTAALARQAGAGQLPGTLLALGDHRPVGMVCLVGRDMPGYEPATALTPWIKGLYVIPPARRRGVGSLLVRRCEAWAASLGHQAVYLYTERGSGGQALYRRLGWRAVHDGRYEGLDVTVMRALEGQRAHRESLPLPYPRGDVEPGRQPARIQGVWPGTRGRRLRSAGYRSRHPATMAE